jgi:hypothetical protein
MFNATIFDVFDICVWIALVFLYFVPFISRRDGSSFFRVLVVFISAHTFLPLLLQVFGLYERLYLIIAHIAVLVLYYLFGAYLFKTPLSATYTSTNTFFRSKDLLKVLFGLLMSVVVFTNLYAIHFNYHGPVSSINSIDYKTKFVNHLPYYSDEWVLIGWVKYSIESKRLPLVNILDADSRPFMHFFSPFVALIGSQFLLSGLDVLDFYTTLHIIFTLLLLFSVYMLMRSYGIGFYASVISTVSVMYIANSANLSVIWHLIPYSAGVLVMIASVYFIEKSIVYNEGGFRSNVVRENFRWSILSSLVSVLLYPPIALFILFLYIYIFTRSVLNKDWYIMKVLLFLLTLSVSGLVLIVSLSQSFSLQSILDVFYGFLVRESLTIGSNPSFNILNIIYWLVIVLSSIGLILAFRKRFHIVFISIFGLIFWSAHYFYSDVFIIEYSRAVAITSIFFTILSAFALDMVFKSIKPYMLNILVSSILILFLSMIGKYTLDDRWSKLLLHIELPKEFEYIKYDISPTNNRYTIMPAPLANQYLTEEDLKLFDSHGLKGQRFISPPWKGLVLGVATENFPMDSKPSTVTVNMVPYLRFMNADCDSRLGMINRHKINYLYIPKIDCDFTVKVGESTEGLVLYRVSK